MSDTIGSLKKLVLTLLVMKSFEKFGAEQQENPDDEKKSVLAWLARINLTIIPAALAAAVSVGEAQAESIETIHGQDWLQGVETLRESVMSAETEVGATFIMGEDGKQYWYSSGKGETTSVKKSASDLKRELAQFTEASGEEVERFCEAHTHNLAAMAAVNFISKDELATFQAEGYGPSVPPSLTDVSIFNEAKIQSAVGETPYFKTVFDAQGIWYSRVPTDSDYDAFPDFRAEIDRKREIISQVFGDYENGFDGGIITPALESMEEQTLEELVLKYGSEHDIEDIERTRKKSPANVRKRLESTLRMALMTNDSPDYPLISEIINSDEDQTKYQEYLDAMSIDNRKFFDDTVDSWVNASKDGQIDESMLDQVYEAYIRNGALVRFVPYDKIPDEPPCAGPDYKSE